MAEGPVVRWKAPAPAPSDQTDNVWEPPMSTWKGASPGPRETESTQKDGISAGGVAGVVVGVVVLVVVLVIFLVRWWRQRQAEKGGGGARGVLATGDLPRHKSSPPPMLEGTLKLSPLQSPLAPASQEMMQQLHHHKIYSSSSTSSSLTSVSTGYTTQSSLVSVGVRAFTYEELSKATDQFNQDNFLGQGGFGSVYKGDVVDNTHVGGGGGVVAIKKLRLQGGGFQGEREFLTEIHVISRVHHKNLVSLSGYCISGLERLLVYEYVENNNLAFHLHRNVTPLLDWPTRLSIALGAAKGIAYLHEECHPRIIHRDIKSTNILLDSNFRPKVADFGLAKFVPDDQTHVTTRVMGTFGYLAPEFGSSGRLTEKSDVFSFGIVLLELITGRQPINLVEWASPFLDQALEDGVFETELIDTKLESNYDYEEMSRMVACAAVSIHRFPDHRPQMSQVVQVLEGNISPEKLKAQTSKPRRYKSQPT